jgi:hypothetical protein
MARPASPLVANLLRVREAVERMVSRLEEKGELSASEEQKLRRGRRVVREISNEHLPWARSPAITEAQSAGIVAWLYRTCRKLELDPTEEG